MRVVSVASEVPRRAMAAAIGAAGIVLGCATATPPVTGGGVAIATAAACPGWLAAQQRGEGRLYAVDAAASPIRLHVFRAGRLAKVGHNHVLGLDRVDGRVFLPADGLAGAGVELGFQLEDLVIDRPEWRAALGDEFASRPTEGDIAGTRANMIRAVDGERFPTITIRSTAVAGAFPTLALKLAVSWHGTERVLDVPMRVERPVGDGPLRAVGALVLRQSDFGIAPFSVLGGLLAIQDELTVDVDITARPSASCG
ncbi:MAG: YceI family protein [Mitsuaria chitosanitabida]|uniref:YceI family protein n=1 Tax=Roseateles chitosanitabidus TaxID=65048 RepID=UPI001B2E6D08|nr:YceI family protein [Roseateles chitosanitabidus]MBO9688528.1 YceI family protein [Roseateles chitosanitabidus]